VVRAIDVHVHLPAPGAPPASGLSSPQVERYFGPARGGRRDLDADGLADHYRSLDMMAVLLVLDTETVSGRPPIPNRYVAEVVARHPDVFVGFGGIDPHKGRIALDQIDEIAELGLRGLKFHAGAQRFYANDRAYYPLWEKCERLGLIVLFHSGTTGVGAGQPGGGGVKLDHMRPVPYIDDVAADFPALRVIMAHPPFPWDREGLAMVRHKSNVFIDLSGWSPTYFDPLLVQYARTIAQDKFLFGSDWPVITPERWMQDFAAYEFEEPALSKIMRDNAAKLLGLEHVIGGS
jgi:uncharacterized protein